MSKSMMARLTAMLPTLPTGLVWRFPKIEGGTFNTGAALPKVLAEIVDTRIAGTLVCSGWGDTMREATQEALKNMEDGAAALEKFTTEQGITL